MLSNFVRRPGFEPVTTGLSRKIHTRLRAVYRARKRRPRGRPILQNHEKHEHIEHIIYLFIYYNLMTQEKMYAIWIICKRVQDPIQGKSPKITRINE